MGASVTQAAVRKVSEALKPVLVSNGFVRRSPNFFRAEDSVHHIVHFQCSQWGSSDSGRFTLNLIVTTPSLFSGFTGKPFPKNPTSASWPISQRLGILVDGRDTWWDVDGKTDPSLIADELIDKYIPQAMEFFGSYQSLQSIEHALNHATEYGDVPGIFPAQVPLALAIIAYDHGDEQLATEHLEGAYAKNAGSSFTQTIDKVCARLTNLKPNKPIQRTPLRGATDL